MTNDSWQTKKLEEIADFQKGKLMQNSTIKTEGTTPYILIDDLRTNKFTHYTPSNNGTACVSKDSLLAWDGANAGTVGGGLEGFVGSTITKISPTEEVEPIYLRMFLSSKFKEFNSHTHGAAVPHLDKDFVLGYSVPLPPIDKQKEIVEKLDSIRKLQETNQKENEKAEELFNSLLNIKLTRKKGRKESKLEDLCTVTSSKRVYAWEYVSQGIPFFRSKEIVELANNREIKTELFISPKRFNELKSKFSAPQQGDILMTAIGTIGEIYIVKLLVEFYFKDGNVLWLKDFKGVHSNFLKLALQVVVEKLKQASSGSAYKALTIDSLKKIIISLPSLVEQKQIISEFELIETNMATLVKQKQLLNDLFESTLNKLVRPN